jgi:hypothetical protein
MGQQYFKVSALIPRSLDEAYRTSKPWVEGIRIIKAKGIGIIKPKGIGIIKPIGVGIIGVIKPKGRKHLWTCLPNEVILPILVG